MTARDALSAASRSLAEAGIPDAGRDARRLLAHVMKVPPDRLSLMIGEPLSEVQQAELRALVARRAAREPVSHLIGRRMFYGRNFLVTPGALDPRPETETLVEVALAEPFANVLDLGLGTGCILLTLLAEMGEAGRDEIWGIGVEKSDDAFEVAWWNRNALGLEDPAVLLKGSWFDPLPQTLPENFAGFDLIVSNPPYVTDAEWEGLEPEVRDHEPRAALTAGPDGLDAFRAILSRARSYLGPGGRLVLEIGAQQGEAVRDLVIEAELGEVRLIQDLEGRDRVVAARRI